MIFIAGNEPFDQGPIVWNQSINLAVKGNILVNTIYCGSAESQERQLWASGAILAKGSNFNINQNQEVVAIKSPYDDEIASWNSKLNQTYIPYGREGKVGQTRQAVEDSNAGKNMVLRSASKASEYYDNASWDLLDALENSRVKLEEISDDSLPEIMRGMTLTEKKAYVAGKKTEREAIKKTIRDLSQKRIAVAKALWSLNPSTPLRERSHKCLNHLGGCYTTYIEQQRKSSTNSGDNTLDSVIIQSLRQQLAAKGFKLN